MMSGVGSLVYSGPLILAIPVAAAAGAVTFLSPCCLPLVPGYLSYVTGMQQPGRHRALAGTALFVLGFSALFTSYGVAFGSVGDVLREHEAALTRVLGVVLIVLGLLFAGTFDRFSFAGRIAAPAVRPRAGLAGAPLLGILFGLGWTPCTGPTLTAVLTLAATTGTAARGALLAFIYALGIGIPFLIVAFAFERGMNVFGFARRHARLVTRIGGALLVAVGILEVTGAWSAAMTWLQVHWIGGYSSPL
jgi:cytochrome c-type biogenesis protein